jgi:VIT1/CCC1 family predicted Fe2+/Mn2+ transporter
MVFYYRNYPYSAKATMISVLANIGGYLAGIGAVVAVAMIENKVLGIALCVILAALALFLFIYVGRKLTDKLNEKWAEENIRTKAGVAFQYVMSHPEEYDRVAAMNPEFAQKYEIGEKGRPVKRK